MSDPRDQLVQGVVAQTGLQSVREALGRHGGFDVFAAEGQWRPHPLGGRYRILGWVHDEVHIEYLPHLPLEYVRVDVHIEEDHG